MKRRDMMKLASLVMMPMMPRAVMASPERRTPPLRYEVFTATRPGLNRDVPPRRESLMWVANSVTLIHGERDAALIPSRISLNLFWSDTREGGLQHRIKNLICLLAVRHGS
jgi:hypothetical protein